MISHLVSGDTSCHSDTNQPPSTQSWSLSRLSHDRPFRLAVQTGGGAALAYLTAKAAGVPEPSWSVISALFVIQASLGGTIRSALSRLMGGAVGLALGLATIFLIGNGGSTTVLGLTIGVAMMAALAAIMPNLSYGLVTVTILTLAPGVEVIEGALVKAVEITLGSLCGAATAAAVMPRPAHRLVDDNLADALEAAADLVAADLRSIASTADAEQGRCRDRMEQALSQSRTLLRQSRPQLRPTGEAVKARAAMRSEIERFWYGLRFLDHLTEPLRAARLPKEAMDLVEELGEAVRDRLLHLAESMRTAEPFNPWRQPADVLENLDKMELSIEDRPIDEVQFLFALTFSCKFLVEGVARIDAKAHSALNPGA
nr:FUSC family protein [arsenite-oxidising bacterium NT-25]